MGLKRTGYTWYMYMYVFGTVNKKEKYPTIRLFLFLLFAYIMTSRTRRKQFKGTEYTWQSFLPFYKEDNFLTTYLLSPHTRPKLRKHRTPSENGFTFKRNNLLLLEGGKALSNEFHPLKISATGNKFLPITCSVGSFFHKGGKNDFERVVSPRNLFVTLNS